LATIAWWIVGTAVYQVGSNSVTQSKKARSSKPGVQTRLPPPASVASSAPTSPWMWNSGITFRQRSSGDSARCAAMLRADATRLACDSGTIFGRAVVPEVCRISATSPGDGHLPVSAVSALSAVSAAAEALPARRNAVPAGRSSKQPAGAAGSTTISITARPSSAATSRIAPRSLWSTITASARASSR
jgi:hypothetical protein